MNFKPKLLDLFCGAGGAARGYEMAGFEVTGVDIEPQKNYPYEFIQMDALELLAVDDGEFVRQTYDAIHASPPCQFYSHMSHCRPDLASKYPNLIGPTRTLLERQYQVHQVGGGWGAGSDPLPWVIENVPGARSEFRDPITLCGWTFGRELYRHRLFEANFELPEPKHRKHEKPGGRAGHWKEGEIISVSGHCSPMWLARQVMEIGWTTREELAEAIPPYFCEYVGKYLMKEVLRRREEAA